MADAVALLRRAVAALEDVRGLVAAGSADARAYVAESLGVIPTSPAVDQAPPTSTSAPTEQERAEAILAGLPVWEPRHKTGGVWIDDDGEEHGLVSGEHDEWFQRARQRAIRLGYVWPGATLATASHVELKFAMRMRHIGMKKAVIVLNNPPCGEELGCTTLLPIFLPDDGQLTVYGPAGFNRTFYGKRRDDSR